MQEGQLLMTQADRDRLVALKKAKKKLITQREAAEELGLSVRQVQRLLEAMKERGDKALAHGLRGKPSNRKVAERIEQQAVKILSAEVYKGFGPTLAAGYLRKKHGIKASKETVRQWMIRGKLWRAKKEKVEQVHVWRPRRSRFGELVQWHDSTAENMKLLWSYLEKFGRPLSFYTGKAALFQTTEKRKRNEPGVEKDAVEMPPTQIGRALRGTGNHLDSGAFPASQRARGAEFSDGAGSAGEGYAGGGRENDRAGQPIPDRRSPGVVGTRVDRGGGQSRRCASAAE